MADEMIFGVGFDVESGTDQAIKDWRVAQKVLQRELDKNTLDVKIKVSDKDSVNQIEKIRDRMKELSEEYDKLSINERFKFNADTGEIDGMTAKAEKLVSEFNKLTIYVETYGRSLKKVSSDAVKELSLQTREIEKQAKESERSDKERIKREEYLKKLVHDRKILEAKGLSVESTASRDDRAYYAELEKQSEKTKQDEIALDRLIKQQQERRKQAEIERAVLEHNINQRALKDIAEKEAKEQAYWENARKSAVQKLTAESTASADDRAYYAQLEKETAERYKHINLIKQKVAILNGEEKSIDQINAKLAIQRQRLNSLDFKSDSFTRVNKEVQRLTTLLAQAEAKVKSVNARGMTQLRSSVANVNKEYSRQLTYVERLLERAGVYGAIFAAGNFITNIRAVTAEFDLQRVSLTAMMQSAADADKLFEQTVAAAVESPFQIKDLIQYTKQLAAFGVENDNLFDTTQMLADITAGLGTDFGRIALAYGQIRSRGFLAGTELKQLTELGLAFPEMLAKRLSAVERSAVTVADVFDRISNREITFDQVENIFKELTEDGGRFYEMQEKQAKTLAGLWSNLQDVMSLMYADIGEDIYDEMRGSIELLKSLVENWRTVADVVTAAGVAYGVYALAMKNAAISSQALTVAEIRNVLVTKQRTLGMKGLVASLVGKTAVEKANIAVSRLYTAATIKANVATNVFTKTFWRLTAAMLANPYVAVAAALAGIATALILSRKEAETTEDRIKSLNKSFAQIENIDKTDKLVNEYEALSQKANKTTEELTRLKTVTNQLAKIYPSAIKDIKNYGDEMVITAGKIRQLHNAEVEVRKELAESTQSRLKQDLTENIKAIEQLRAILASGEETLLDTSQRGFVTEYTRALDDERKQEIIDSINSLYESNDEIQTALDQFAEKEITETAIRVGGWQKVFAEARAGLVPLYSQEQIGLLGNLDKALEDVAGKYKEAKATVDDYNRALASTSISEQEREQITLARDNQKAQQDALYALLQRYNALSLVASTEKTTNTARLKNLQAEATLLQEIYKRYQEYLKYMSASDAQAKIKDLYKDSIANLSVDVAFDGDQLETSLKDVRKQLLALGTKEALEVAAKLGLTIDDVDYKELQDKLKKDLARISDEIKRSKEAQNFMQNILSATGNEQLATEMTVSIYGNVGDGLVEQMKSQIVEAFSGGTEMSDALSQGVNKAIKGTKIDYKALQDLIPLIDGEENQKQAQALVDAGLAANAKYAENLIKSLNTFQDYETRRTAIAKKGEEDREAIRELGLSKELEEQQLAASKRKQTEEIAKVDVEEFESSEDYIRIFMDLEKISTQTIDSMRGKLKEYIEQLQATGASAEVLKPLIESFEKLNDESLERKPLQALRQGIKDYTESSKEYQHTKKEVEKAEADLAKAEADKKTAEQNFDSSIESGKAYAKAIKEAEEATEKLSQAQRNNGKAADDMRKALKNTNNAFNEVGEIGSAALSGVTSLLGAMGIELDGALGSFIGGFDKALGALASIDLTKPASIITGAFGVLEGVWDQTFGAAQAQRVKKANEEIERQAELISKLEYTYGRLQSAAENALGMDYVKNYNAQVENLLAQAEAAQAQATAERAKGKDEDESATQGYLDQYQDTMTEYENLLDEYASIIIGSGLGDLTKEISSLWLEAKLAGESTMDALKAKSKEMVQSMVSDFVMAAAIERALQPVFDLIDDSLENADLMESPDYWAKVATELNEAMENSDTILSALYDALAKAGVDLTDSTSGLSGISKDIASASEESILGLAAGINTQNYYIGGIKQDTAMIVAILRGGSAGLTPLPSVDVTTLITMQNGYLQNLPAIATHTANTVLECQNIVRSVDKVVTRLDRVIKTKGSQTNFVVKTEL